MIRLHLTTSANPGGYQCTFVTCVNSEGGTHHCIKPFAMVDLLCRKCPFSTIALDHAHEQCNAMVKGDGSAVGLASTTGALRRWVTAGPQTAMSKALHCKRPSRETFKLVFLLRKLGNPFEDDGECLFTLDSKVIVNAAAMTSVSSVITTGMQQHNSFVVERLEKITKPINNPLRKNKLHVFV